MQSKYKSNLHYTHILVLPFRVSRVSSAHLRGFVPGPTHQNCCRGDGKFLATCERYDWLGI